MAFIETHHVVFGFEIGPNVNIERCGSDYVIGDAKRYHDL